MNFVSITVQKSGSSDVAYGKGGSSSLFPVAGDAWTVKHAIYDRLIEIVVDTVEMDGDTVKVTGTAGASEFDAWVAPIPAVDFDGNPV
jgi:hypothetical protein